MKSVHRFNILRILNFVIVLFLFYSCQNNQQVKEAPLFDNLGNHHFPVTTNSELAQKYFDQGIIFSFGFNHLEAFRSFNEAARLDSNCAMAYWGMALVLGPNINAPMDNADIKTAYDAIQKAIEKSEGVSEKEKDFIIALSKRYTNKVVEDRSTFDSAYAEAMRELANKYPDDSDLQTLFAEALMDLHPWDFWLKDGTPQQWTAEIISVLENVLEKSPDHPGANHLYIHTVEASKNPQKGITSADRLRQLIPGAGHLVHMPAHIYIRVGKYHDGSLANEMAVKSDEAYLTQCRMQGLYPTAYYPHNYHFLWATATLEGRSKTALDAAQKVSEKVQDSMMTMCGYSTLQHFYVIPYYAYVRFGRWNEILNSPKPSDDTPYAQAVWHYARGMAMVANNKLEEADNELQELVKYESDEKVSQLAIWGINYAGDLVKIAKELLTGEIAAKQKNYNLAIIHLQKAVEVEYKLRYDEPPTWFHQVSHHLGAVLLEAGKYKDAENVYRDDLAEFPENGWALFGLLQSLKMQGKDNEVVEVEKRFKEAWKYADIELKSSRII